jgi:hypothetical protein
MRKKNVQSANSIDKAKINWALLIYSHSKVKIITKVQKTSNISEAFRTSSSIKKTLDTTKT